MGSSSDSANPNPPKIDEEQKVGEVIQKFKAEDSSKQNFAEELKIYSINEPPSLIAVTEVS